MTQTSSSIDVAFLNVHSRIYSSERMISLISSFFRNLIVPASDTAHSVRIDEVSSGGHDIIWNETSLGTFSSPALTLQRLLVAFREHAGASDDGKLLRASAVGWGSTSIMITGDSTEAGNVAAWFVARGFSYISQGFVRIAERPDFIEGAAGPMMIGRAAASALCEMEGLRQSPSLATPAGLLVQPDTSWAALNNPSRCALIMDIRSVEVGDVQVFGGNDLTICSRLAWTTIQNSHATASRQLAASYLVGAVPTISVHLGSMSVPDPTLDTLTRFISEEGLTKRAVADLLKAIRPEQSCRPLRSPAVPHATVRRPNIAPKLTIGMATYDDYDGVYFSVQALRLYHSEVIGQTEIVVIDNNPVGPCASSLKELDSHIENYRYIPETNVIGTAIRDRIFAEAAGTYVLCMDCHVLFQSGSISALLRYFDQTPDTNDLIQGPLIWDDLKVSSAFWEPEWGSGMFGKWALDSSVAPHEPAFEIQMQGLGVFACRKSAWPGFNTGFRGFGGEEGYIHEKFRKRGDRVMCLPALRWTHRFARPMGIQYPINWEDRIQNYLLGRRELGLPEEDVILHMRAHLGSDYVDTVLNTLKI